MRRDFDEEEFVYSLEDTNVGFESVPIRTTVLGCVCLQTVVYIEITSRNHYRNQGSYV